MVYKVCQNCGKGKLRGHKVSHAKQRTIKFSKPNLHWQKVVIKGVKKRLLLCTRCVRLLKKSRRQGRGSSTETSGKAKAETKSPKPLVEKG